ncbi:MAG: valine--tRNA ligase, partial [Candidatus Hydrothermota bacterium]
EITVSTEKPEKCPKCGSSRIRQDEDVLDTWFSSWLWPISTLGWPEDTDWLRAFYPGDVLVTGWDILFFWVARMIMSGTHFMGKAPFKYVYLHGLVRDEKRRKLSKSLGNSPDPLDLIDRYGADGVRMGMMLITPEGRDILFSEKKMELGRNFANKIWNASRFLLLNAEGTEKGELPDELELEDKWILQGLDDTISNVLKYMESFDFNSAAWELYDFFWHEFCDWYLESIKPRIKELSDRRKALNVAFYVLEKYLRLLHPFMPFITEEIWQNLPNKKGDALIIADYPEPQGFSYGDDRHRFDLLRELISELRDVRASFNVPKGEKISLYLKGDSKEVGNLVLSKSQLLGFLAGVEEVKVQADPPGGSAAIIVENHEFYVPLGGLIDVGKELARIQRELAELKSLIEKTQKKLENPSFLQKAPPEVVQKEKEKLEKFREKARKLELSAGRLSA